MNIKVFINSYNYCNYIGEAVGSVLNQTRRPDKIVVIDDGSTDGTINLLESKYADKITLITKPNGGQLSCFNKIPEFTAPSDIVFFLDADDCYKPHHIESSLEVYRKNPDVDFVFSNFESFGAETGFGCQHISSGIYPGDIGYTAFPTRYLLKWIGYQTSTISMKGSLLHRILPYYDEAAWRSCGDDVLVTGSSLVGGRKFHLNDPTILYRIHETNAYTGRTLSKGWNYLNHSARLRMAVYYGDRGGLTDVGSDRLLRHEFSVKPNRSRHEFYQYLQVIFASDFRFLKKIKCLFSITANFCLPLVKRIFLKRE